MNLVRFSVRNKPNKTNRSKDSKANSNFKCRLCNHTHTKRQRPQPTATATTNGNSNDKPNESGKKKKNKKSEKKKTVKIIHGSVVIRLVLFYFHHRCVASLPYFQAQESFVLSFNDALNVLN